LRDVPTPAGSPIRPDGTSTAAAHGRLIIRATPPDAVATVNGRRYGPVPVTIDRLRPGTYRVRVERGAASLEQTVTLTAGESMSILLPLIDSGWLDVRAPFDVQMYEDAQLLGTSSDGPVATKAGSHRLVLRNDAVGYEEAIVVQVDAGAMTRVRPAVPDGVLQVNAQPWANVFVDGQPVGETPLGTLRVALGSHEVRFEHPTLGQQVRQVVISARTPARISVDLR
jgi:hypothetical protein